MLRAELAPSTGSIDLGEFKDFPTLPGYVLFQRPTDIRIIGLDPVMQSTIFDMVSTGRNFRVSIPRKKQFIEGDNDSPPTARSEYLFRPLHTADRSAEDF